jgi:hypothetical protein
MWIAWPCPAEEAPGAAGEAAQEEEAAEHQKVNTPDATTVDPGHFEIESSYAFEQVWRFWDSGGHERRQPMERDSAAGLAVVGGILENLDLELNSTYQWIKDEENNFDGEGFGDLNLNLRYRFVNDTKRHLEIAYIEGMTFPIGSRATEKEYEAISTNQEYWSLNQTLVVSKDWGRWTGDADVGYSQAFGAQREHVIGVLNGDAALGYQVLPWLQPEIELNYAHTFTEHISDQDLIAATVGLVIPINESWQLMVGVQEGLWGRNTDEATTCRVALRWVF